MAENKRDIGKKGEVPVNDFVAPHDPTEFHMPVLESDADVRKWELGLMSKLKKGRITGMLSTDDYIERVCADSQVVKDNPRRLRLHRQLKND